MVIYVWKYNNGLFIKTAIIDYASSVIWVSRFCDCGEFELYIPASRELVELFQGEVLLTRDDSDTTMVFEKLQLTTDKESGDFLTITGRSLESVLSRRVVNRQTTLEGTVADGLKRLLNETVINPINPLLGFDEDRIIPNIEIGDIDYLTDELNKQITGENLLNVIIDICTNNDLGFKLNNKADINKFIFSVYSGSDISDRLIFSSKFGNLGKTEFTYDYAAAPNFFYVAGEGEGLDRIIIEAALVDILPLGYVGNIDFTQFQGLLRREYWIDQRDCSSDSPDPKKDTFYFSLLQRKAVEKYQELKSKVIYTGEILNTEMYKYGVDYNLGDIVLIENDYGIKAKATIIEITEVEDATGYTIAPKLSEWRVTDV